MILFDAIHKMLLSLCLCAIIATSGSAGIVISIENTFVSPGQTALLGIFASSDASDSISGFNLPLDFNADGKRTLPSGFSLGTIQVVNPIFGDTKIDLPEPQLTISDIDGIASGFIAANFATTLGPARTKLFDIVFEVGSSVPVGTVLPVKIAIDRLGLFNVTSPSGGIVIQPIIGTPSLGSITVIAVPEPSTVLLITTCVVLLFCCRIRLSASRGKRPNFTTSLKTAENFPQPST